MNLSKVKEIYDSPLIDSEINIGGWVRAFRANKFIELNDGSTIKNIQCVIDDGIIGEDIIKRISVGCSLIITGILVNSCLLYTSPSPRDRTRSRMPSSA